MPEKESGREREGRKSNIFMEMACGFVSGFTAILEENIGRLFKRQERKFFRSFGAYVIILAGALFALNGLAVFINEFLRVGDWPGYVLVGLVVIVIGFILQKSAQSEDYR